MRIVTFRGGQGLVPAIEHDGEVCDIGALARAAGWNAEEVSRLGSGRAVAGLRRERLAELEETLRAQTAALREHGALLPRAEVRLGPPIPDPEKIICLGLNYRDHAAEAGLQAPAAPMFFAKFANSLAGPEDQIIPPALTRQVDYEAELAVVIGRRCRQVDAKDAIAHVFGAMAFNDVSARDLQLANNLWMTGKAIDTFAPCGPALVTVDEIGDLQRLALSTRVNGETLQEGTTASMIFGVAETIAFLSQLMTLEPGDVIATGTPAGVGASRSPKRFLKPGDTVEVELEGVGTLRNRVAAEAG